MDQKQEEFAHFEPRYRASLEEFEEAEPCLQNTSIQGGPSIAETSSKLSQSGVVIFSKNPSLSEISENAEGLPVYPCVIHANKIAKYVETCGDPSSWRYFCSGCAIDLVQKGRKLFKMSKSKRTFPSLSNILFLDMFGYLDQIATCFGIKKTKEAQERCAQMVSRCISTLQSHYSGQIEKVNFDFMLLEKILNDERNDLIAFLNKSLYQAVSTLENAKRQIDAEIKKRVELEAKMGSIHKICEQSFIDPSQVRLLAEPIFSKVLEELKICLPELNKSVECIENSKYHCIRLREDDQAVLEIRKLMLKYMSVREEHLLAKNIQKERLCSDSCDFFTRILNADNYSSFHEENLASHRTSVSSPTKRADLENEGENERRNDLFSFSKSKKLMYTEFGLETNENENKQGVFKSNGTLPTCSEDHNILRNLPSTTKKPNEKVVPRLFSSIYESEKSKKVVNQPNSSINSAYSSGRTKSRHSSKSPKPHQKSPSMKKDSAAESSRKILHHSTSSDISGKKASLESQRINTSTKAEEQSLSYLALGNSINSSNAPGKNEGANTSTSGINKDFFRHGLPVHSKDKKKKSAGVHETNVTVNLFQHVPSGRSKSRPGFHTGMNSSLAQQMIGLANEEAKKSRKGSRSREAKKSFGNSSHTPSSSGLKTSSQQARVNPRMSNNVYLSILSPNHSSEISVKSAHSTKLSASAIQGSHQFPLQQPQVKPNSGISPTNAAIQKVAYELENEKVVKKKSSSKSRDEKNKPKRHVPLFPFRNPEPLIFQKEELERQREELEERKGILDESEKETSFASGFDSSKATSFASLISQKKASQGKTSILCEKKASATSIGFGNTK